MQKRNTVKPHVEHLLSRVMKPARYVGGELNVIRKDPEKQNISVCLAFPDIYDIGQSYMGFYILYHILNHRDGTLCERTFAPWNDMEELMRAERIPLWSLESFLPVSCFDVVGFTLQYELHYTTILNMLDLAGIPLRAVDRGEADPIVLGGGTNCANPEPVAVYFDGFLLGDGEEAFPEMLDVIERSKIEGRSRHDTLLELAGIGGVYVPALYRPIYGPGGTFAGMERLTDRAAFPVRARFVERLKPEYYPDRPLVPLCEVVHDRLAVEIMRGCSRGCRFCGAGMIYRPKRVRPVEDIVRQVVNGIRTTGWEDVSLVSLSTSDYHGLDTVVRRIGEELGDKAVSISLSSLRADNFSLAMAEAVAGGRKSGLTFAVEAGSQRLRDVINKNLTEDQLLETVKTALSGGWGGFKLYFMIGLPTETDGDVIGIANLLNRIGRMLKQYKGRQINVTVSPFVPKPHTPFQWEGMEPHAVLNGKIGLIRANLRSRSVHLKMPDLSVSMLENILGRGGREINRVIENAWKHGSRLDGWSEHFKDDVWRAALEKAGISLESGGGRLEAGAPLPWSHLDYGVDEAFLRSEREKAFRGEHTGDCSEACQACGPYVPFCAAVKRNQDSDSAAGLDSHTSAETKARFGRKPRAVSVPTIATPPFKSRVRIKFGKDGLARYTSQLDLIRIFDRTLRRSGIPVAYSQGFHPHPKISFGPPLPLGMKSRAEYADFSLGALHHDIASALSTGWPEGFFLVDIASIPEKTISLSELIVWAEYEVKCAVDNRIERAIGVLIGQTSIPFERTTKRGPKSVDIRPGIDSIRIAGDRSGFTMILSLDTDNSVKPAEVLTLIFGDDQSADVTRTEQYADLDGERIPPLELLRHHKEKYEVEK